MPTSTAFYIFLYVLSCKHTIAGLRMQMKNLQKFGYEIKKITDFMKISTHAVSIGLIYSKSEKSLTRKNSKRNPTAGEHRIMRQLSEIDRGKSTVQRSERTGIHRKML